MPLSTTTHPHLKAMDARPSIMTPSKIRRVFLGGVRPPGVQGGAKKRRGKKRGKKKKKKKKKKRKRKGKRKEKKGGGKKR